jgi:heme-degrading monooxygenase HmoA
MIVRCWKGIATNNNAKKYIEHLDRSIIPVLRTLKGFERIEVMKRDVEKGVEFQVQTYWRTMGDITQFAAPNISEAVVADEARAVLSTYDKTVTHYEEVTFE